MRHAAAVRLLALVAAPCLAVACSAGSGHPAQRRAAHNARQAAAAGKRGAAARTRLVSYRGVQVDVPASWPVVDGMHTAGCGEPFPGKPTAYVGPNLGGPGAMAGCPFIDLRRLPRRDGVWLQPGIAPSNARTVTTRSGTVVRAPGRSELGPFLQVWFHRISIQIEIGRDPRVARAIFNSIGYAPGTPNTHAAGVCARSADPNAMPVPHRLRHRLVIEQHTITMAPPRPSDRPVMTAAAAWSQGGPREPFDRYRLWLVRYSSKYPAVQNANGTTSPDNHDELAWVIYAEPLTSVAGCGGWGLDAFDAITGHGIDSAGWAPGP